jgi:hypothetical protein
MATSSARTASNRIGAAVPPARTVTAARYRSMCSTLPGSGAVEFRASSGALINCISNPQYTDIVGIDRRSERPGKGLPTKAPWARRGSPNLLRHGSKLEHLPRAPLAHFAGHCRPLWAAGVIAARGSDLLGRHPSGHVAHLLVNIVPPRSVCEGIELRAQVGDGLALKPRSPDRIAQLPMAPTARCYIARRRTACDNLWRPPRQGRVRRRPVANRRNTPRGLACRGRSGRPSEAS